MPGLAAPGHAGDDRQHAQRELHVDVLEVVLHRPVHGDGILPRPLRADVRLPLAGKVLEGERTLELLRGELLHNALEDHFPAMDAGFRAHVDEEVRRADDLRVVLHHDDGVADVAEALEDRDEAVGVAGVQADGRLVQDVHRPDQRAAERGHEVHALAFAAGEGVHRAAQGEVPEAHVLDAVQPEDDLVDALAGDAALVVRQLDGVEEREELVGRWSSTGARGCSSRPRGRTAPPSGAGCRRRRGRWSGLSSG